MIPELEYRVVDGVLSYRWQHVVHGFVMPVLVQINGESTWLRPEAGWQTMGVPLEADIAIDPGFYVTSRELE